MNEQKGVFKNLYKNLMTPILKKDSGIDAESLTNLLGKKNQVKIKKYLLFEWRNWRLIPKDKKYWIIEKKES